MLATGVVPNKALGESLKGKYLEFAEMGIASNRGVSARLSRKEFGQPQSIKVYPKENFKSAETPGLKTGFLVHEIKQSFAFDIAL